jgi:chromosome segregation ATPase
VADQQSGADHAEGEGLRERLSAAGEEALGDLAQVLLENPLLNQALTTALGAGERAIAAQRSAISALNLSSASDVERLERRLRSLFERLEGLEDRIDEVADDVAVLRAKLAGAESVSSDRERLRVPEPDD